MKRLNLLVLVTVMLGTMGLACAEPQFTHTNAQSPWLFNHFFTDDLAVFHPYIFPGTLNIRALNASSDSNLELHMIVSSGDTVFIYDATDTTYYSLHEDDGEQEDAIDALREILVFKPVISTATMEIEVDYNDMEHPIIKIELDDIITDSDNNGMIWQVKILSEISSTKSIRRGSGGGSSTYMNDDRVLYFRQGETNTDDVDLTASTVFDGDSTSDEPKPILTFEREMGALYVAYFNKDDPSDSEAGIPWFRTVDANGVNYEIVTADELTPGETYYFVIAQKCNGLSDDGCVDNMSLSQDMAGNPVAVSLNGWITGDLNAVTGGDTTGVRVIYYEFQVEYRSEAGRPMKKNRRRGSIPARWLLKNVIHRPDNIHITLVQNKIGSSGLLVPGHESLNK